MEWSKLKNIILLILLATNLFLLFLVGYRNWNTARYESGARSDALTVLAKNGIAMDKEALPKDALLSTASVSRDREGEADLLAPLLGSVSGQALGGSQFLYSGEKGQVYFRSRGDFAVSLEPEAYPLSGSMADHAREVLALMGFHGSVTDVTGTAQNGSVTLVQLWEDTPVLNCTVRAVYRSGSLVSASGTRLSGTPAVTGSAELSAVTGLLRFLELFTDTGDVCSRVNVMRGSYQLSSGPSDPATLTPVWYFETDTGTYTLDMTLNQLKKL